MIKFLLGEIIVILLTFFLLSIALVSFISASDRESERLHVALVENSFTGAAYGYHGFYDFYKKHDDEMFRGKKVVEDLNYLTAKIPKYSKQYQPSLLANMSTQLKNLLPNADVSIITDVDVHEGAIFNNRTGNGNNIYDILILGHQEYVTEQEYLNLKSFVSNGGTLIITTGNVFYVEVTYDKNTNSISLDKGHYWEFNGKVAQKGVRERWENETKKWLGSNSYPIFYWEENYHKLFNNPFNFTGEGGGEEQYFDKTNPNVRVILDYKSSDSRYPIATYELKYGKGKVIVIGIAAEDILDPCEEYCLKFYKFLDGLLLKYAIPSQIQ